jgi:hypothetical protein
MTLDFNRMHLSTALWLYDQGVDIGEGYLADSRATKGSKEDFHTFDLASKNHLLLVWAARCTNTRAPYEVGLLHGNCSEYFSERVIVRTALLAMLVQCYRLRASMEIHFVGPRNADDDASVHTGFEPGVPLVIQQFAADLGIAFANRSMISDAEGRELFVRMTLSPDEVAKIKKCRMKPLVVAFIVNRGTWTDNEFYAILNYCGEPRHVFDGDLRSIIGIPLEAARSVLRSAYLAERVINDLQMALGDTPHGQDSIEFRWLSERTIEVTSHYSFEKEVLHGELLTIEAGRPLVIGLYAGMKEDIHFEFTFNDCFKQYSGCNALYFSSDFSRVSQVVLAKLKGFSADTGASLLAVQLSADKIDQECLAKISRSGNLSMELEGGAND